MRPALLIFVSSIICSAGNNLNDVLLPLLPCDGFDYPVISEPTLRPSLTFVSEQISQHDRISRSNFTFPWNPNDNEDAWRSTDRDALRWNNVNDTGEVTVEDGLKRYHAGEDWNIMIPSKVESGMAPSYSDAGELTYSIADGLIIDVGRTQTSGQLEAAGWTIVVAHRLPGSSSVLQGDGEPTEFVFSVYTHVAPLTIRGRDNTLGDLGSFADFDDIEFSRNVRRGDPICRIANLSGPGSFLPHLHFELRTECPEVIQGGVRSNLYPSASRVGYYRCSDAGQNASTCAGSKAASFAFGLMQTDGILDPSDFIDRNRRLQTIPASTLPTRYFPALLPANFRVALTLGNQLSANGRVAGTINGQPWSWTTGNGLTPLVPDDQTLPNIDVIGATDDGFFAFNGNRYWNSETKTLEEIPPLTGNETATIQVIGVTNNGNFAVQETPRTFDPVVTLSLWNPSTSLRYTINHEEIANQVGKEIQVFAQRVSEGGEVVCGSAITDSSTTAGLFFWNTGSGAVTLHEVDVSDEPNFFAHPELQVIGMSRQQHVVGKISISNQPIKGFYWTPLDGFTLLDKIPKGISSSDYVLLDSELQADQRILQVEFWHPTLGRRNVNLPIDAPFLSDFNVFEVVSVNENLDILVSVDDETSYILFRPYNAVRVTPIPVEDEVNDLEISNIIHDQGQFCFQFDSLDSLRPIVCEAFDLKSGIWKTLCEIPSPSKRTEIALPQASSDRRGLFRIRRHE